MNENEINGDTPIREVGEMLKGLLATAAERRLMISITITPLEEREDEDEA